MCKVSSYTAIQIIKQIADKVYEHNIKIEMVFTDFKEVFSKRKRNCMAECKTEALEEIKIPYYKN